MKTISVLVFSLTCTALLLGQASGTIVTTINITSSSAIPGGTLGGPCSNYNTQYQTIDTAHLIKCVNPNTNVSYTGVWTDITSSGGGGATLPSTLLVLKGNNAGGALAGVPGTDYLTTATLPLATATPGAVKSVGCTAGSHATGAFAADGTPTCSADTGGASTIPSGPVSGANAGAAAGAGSIYYATDAAGGGSPYYYRPTPGAAPVQFLTLGGSGALAMTGGNVLDINTSVIPQIGNANSWAGTQTFTNAVCSGTCTGFGGLSAASQDGNQNVTLTGLGTGATVFTMSNTNAAAGGIHNYGFSLGTDGNLTIFDNNRASGSFAGGFAQDGRVIAPGGLQAGGLVAAPACASGYGGLFWYIAGATGVKDLVQVCAKDAGNTYAWRTIY